MLTSQGLEMRDSQTRQGVKNAQRFFYNDQTCIKSNSIILHLPITLYLYMAILYFYRLRCGGVRAGWAPANRSSTPRSTHITFAPRLFSNNYIPTYTYL